MKHKKPTNFGGADSLRASEIGQYCFCSISWYLQKCGYKPKSPLLEIGIKKHEDLGNIIYLTQKRNKKSEAIASAGYLFLIFGILIFLFEVIL